MNVIGITKSLGLSGNKLIVLDELMTNELCPTARLSKAVYGNRLVDPGSIAVLICSLRKQLSEHGVSIMSKPRVGYWLTEADKKRIHDIAEAS